MLFYVLHMCRCSANTSFFYFLILDFEGKTKDKSRGMLYQLLYKLYVWKISLITFQNNNYVWFILILIEILYLHHVTWQSRKLWTCILKQFIYSNCNLQDDVTPGQIKQVEQYIIQFNDKQVIVLTLIYSQTPI